MTILRRPLVLAALPLLACASVSPRFSQELAASFAQQPMRKLETPSAEIYYPASARETSLRIAARASECLEAIRGKTITQRDRGKALLFLTSANYNNAYVGGGGLGEPLQSVAPLHTTLELFHWYHLGASEVGDVSCHELVHYVQLEQTDGFWHGLNTLFGDLYSPNGFTERWFLEGLAQYYEGRIGRSTGRPHSAFYRGNFESGVAQRQGELGGGDLNIQQRELLPFSGAYLTGLYFVDYLARRYGDEKLWRLVELQGRSVFSPLWVTLRFKSIYGKSVGALLDDFSEELKRTVKPRERPAGQQVLVRELGYAVRIATSPRTGAIATLTEGRDVPARLAIRDREGRLRQERALTLFIPGRQWVNSGPLEVSGLDFTADGRFLFLTNADLSSLGDSAAYVWKVDAQTLDVVQQWGPFRGFGGSVRPDGKAYAWVEMVGDTANLVELDLASGGRRALTHFEGQQTVAAPAYSPDGKQLVFSRQVGASFDLFLRAEDGSVRALTGDGAFNYGARWLDADRVLFAREHQGRVQAHVLDLRSGALRPVSGAPYVALDPAPLGDGRVVFANREGWGWSLDAVSAPTRDEPPLSTASATVVVEEEASRPPTPSRPEVEVLRDEPYSAFDHLFVPTLRVPLAVFFPTLDAANNLVLGQLYSASLQGKDRLGFHSWALRGSLELPTRDNAFSIQYGNQQLAPLSTRLSLSRSRTGVLTDLSGVLSVSRAFWTTPVYAGLSALQRDSTGDASHPAGRSRLIGPSAGFDYFAGENTPYGGTRRALGFNAQASYYPAAIGSSFDLADLGAELTAAPALPLLRRHSLILGARGRALLGAPRGLLQVGGVNGLSLLGTKNFQRGFGPPAVLLPGLTFAESVRGYEDHGVRATRVGIASARYRYPVVIDRGFASTLYLFPSLFFRQVDVELFGEAARTDDPRWPWLRSAGGAVSLRMVMMQQLPISLTYQVAARFDQRLAPLHLVGLGLQ